MLIWDYPHEIEYCRELAKGHRVHEYTEYVDDQGFCFEHRAERQESYLAHYTRVCAEDYFARVRAAAGTWIVSAYRLVDGERRHLVTIKMLRKVRAHPLTDQ
ncbi:MAG: hypothetical protein GEU98_23360 [Pseudonocardiaceae bacterium]|nr:hypothetical protein [Pseudonocardiaceae bacterium]